MNDHGGVILVQIVRGYQAQLILVIADKITLNVNFNLDRPHNVHVALKLRKPIFILIKPIERIVQIF